MKSHGSRIPSAALRRWPGFLVLLSIIAFAGAAGATDYVVKEVPIPSALLQRESVRFVTLDLVAKRKIDGRWQWVPGITRDRVEVQVKGKLVEIEIFESHCPVEGEAPPDVPGLATAEGAPSAEANAIDAGPRRFILYFDLQHLTIGGSQAAFAAARKWAQQEFLPDDEVMIVTGSLGLRVVRSMRPASQDLMEDLARAEQDYRGTAGWAQMEGDSDRGRIGEILEWKELNQGARPGQSLADSYATEDFRYAKRSLTNLEVLTASFEAMEGTKNLIFFQETVRMYPGHQYPDVVQPTLLRPFAQSLAESANERNVRIYPVDAGGMDGEADEVLYLLASETGGRFFAGSNDLSPMLEWITEDSSCYYRIGFRDRPKFSGQVDRIRIEIDGPRETRKYRMRYRQTLADPTRDELDTAMLQAALMDPMRARDLPLEVSASPFLSHKHGGRVLLQIRVPLDALLPLPAGKRGESSQVLVQVGGIVLPLRDGASSYPEETTNVMADVATNKASWNFQRQALLKLPHPADQPAKPGHEVVLVREVDAPPGRYRVVVVVQDRLARLVGAGATDFEIPTSAGSLGELHLATLDARFHFLGQPSSSKRKRDGRRGKGGLGSAPATFPVDTLIVEDVNGSAYPQVVYGVCGGWRGSSPPAGVELQRVLTCGGREVALESPLFGKADRTEGCSLLVETLPAEPIQSGDCRFEVRLLRSGSLTEVRALDLPEPNTTKAGA